MEKDLEVIKILEDLRNDPRGTGYITVGGDPVYFRFVLRTSTVASTPLYTGIGGDM